VYVPNVSSVFRCILQVFYLDVAKYILMLHIHAYCKRMFQVFYMYVVSVLSGCYIYFAMTTHMFFWCFRRMLQVFQLFRTYGASISSRCYKSRSNIAHVALGPTYHSHLLHLLGPCVCVWERRGREWQAQETKQAQIETWAHAGVENRAAWL
jgi:hypothetical protein